MHKYYSGTRGQECCYNSDGLLIVGPTDGGTILYFASRIDESPWPHYINDILPRINCCKSPGSSIADCSHYFSTRTYDDCSSFNPEPPG